MEEKKKKKKDPEAIVREIKRKTRRKFSSEEKIRIVLEGLRGEDSIATICRREGITIESIIALGGVAKKSPFVMQTLADVLNMPIKVATTEQTCAFGAAMFAAVAGGVYDKVEDAQQAMGKGFDKTYYINSINVSAYDNIYGKYLELGKFVEKNS